MNRTSRLLLAVGLLFPTLAVAQQETFQIDPGKSQVQFSLTATMHPVHGSFKVQSGIISFTPGTTQIGGSIVVDARSGDSGESSRDKKMTQDQLKANDFATVSFAPKSFTGQLAPEGDSNIAVDGAFTLLGRSHDLTVPMHVHIDHGGCKATGTFQVPFVSWGVKDPSNFMLKVGKEVTVELDLVGSVSSATAH